MGTKNNPGQFDCYAKAAPNEPYFVLLARDPWAPSVIGEWIRLSYPHQSDEKLKEAADCAAAMERWRRASPPETKP